MPPISKRLAATRNTVSFGEDPALSVCDSIEIG
jgi:hypothetical protein